jgi:hypothetical protein
LCSIFFEQIGSLIGISVRLDGITRFGSLNSPPIQAYSITYRFRETAILASFAAWIT